MRVPVLSAVVVGSALCLAGLLQGCGSSGDSAGSANPGALQVVRSLQSAATDNSRAEASGLYSAGYSYLGQSPAEAIENVFSGFCLANSLGIQNLFRFSSASLTVQSYVPVPGGAQLVVQAAFTGSWTPISVNGASRPTAPNAVGSATLRLTLSNNAGNWQILKQEFLDSSIGVPGAAAPDVQNLSVNGTTGTTVSPASNLHITGSVSNASAIAVVPDISGSGTGYELIDMTAVGRAAGNRTTRATSLTGLADALAALSAHLGAAAGGAAQQFASDQPASTTAGPTAAAIFVLALDSNRNVTGVRIRTSVYTVAGGPPVVPGNPAIVANVPVGKGPGLIVCDPTIHHVYVLNITDQTLSIIDGVGSQVLSTIPMKNDNNTDIAVDTANHHVYISHEDFVGTVSVVDGVAMALAATIPVGTFPASLAVDPGLNRVYVASQGLFGSPGSVTVVDGATDTPIGNPIAVGNAASNIACDTTTHRVYVVNRGDHTVTPIEEPAGTTLPPISVGSSYGYGIAVNSSLDKVYVAAAGNVTIIDGQHLSQSPVILPASQPNGVVVNPANNEAYVLDQQTVAAISGATDQVVHSIVTGSTFAVAVDQVTDRVFIRTSPHTLIAVDGSTDSILGTIPVGDLGGVGGSSLVAVDPSIGRLYVTNADTNSVSVIDESKIGQ